MNVADDVAESIGLGRSDLVVRHGDEVNVSFMEEERNIPEYIAKKIIDIINSSKTNCIVNLNLLTPIVLYTPISYFLSLIFIIFITNNTTAAITNVMIRNVVANVSTFSIDFVAFFISSKFVVTV